MSNGPHPGRQALLTEIKRAIEAAAGSRRPFIETRYHRHREYKTYGLKTADFRVILKSFHGRLLQLPLSSRLSMARALLASHIGELEHTGLYILGISSSRLGPGHFDMIDDLAVHFRSWSHVDHLCLEVIKPLLLTYREETLALLERWRGTPNRWIRRAGVVAFVRKIAASGEFTEEALNACEQLIWDPEDIVRKGVGWCLKDNLRSSPDRVLPYIKDLRQRGVSSVIVLYAIRDLKGDSRKEILSIKAQALR